jgi:hypothetical protein
MLFLPFLAILMVVNQGHVFSEETVPIPMLADFGTIILGPVKTYCQNPGQEGGEKEKIKGILCGSVKALDNKFLEFGKSMMLQMNFGKPRTIHGHSVSQLQ